MRARSLGSKAASFVVLCAAVAGCGEPNGPDQDQTTLGAGTRVESYALLSGLPTCTPARRAEVYYVEAEQRLYYCDGRTHRPLEDGRDGEDGR